MTSDVGNALFSELLMADQLVRNRLSKVLPKGMELSAFRGAEPAGAPANRTHPPPNWRAHSMSPAGP